MKYFVRNVRRLAVLLVLTGVVTLFGGSLSFAAEDDVPFTEIATPEALRAIADAPDGNYRLTADMDMGGTDWEPLAFRGKLDGAGHTLYNLRVTSAGKDNRETKDGNLKPYDTSFAGLFSVLEHAEVTDLSLKGASVEMENDGHCFAALLAGYVDHASITGCRVEGQVHMINHAINAGVGGLAGYGNADFDRCEADVELIFEDRRTESRCEQFMGGVLSCGVGNITGCTVAIQGYDSCFGYVHNGGLVGMYYHCGQPYRSGVVNNNVITGRITFFEKNPDRRAYCKAAVGETLSSLRQLEGNQAKFQRNEVMTYDKTLLPEMCETPQIADTVQPSTCTEWGYTEHRCDGCGHTRRDSYTPPAHTPGEWTVISPSDTAHEGLRRLMCTVCGQTVSEETIPVKQADKTLSAALPWPILLGATVILVCALIGGGWLFLRRRTAAV